MSFTRIKRRSFMAGVAGLIVPRQLVLGEDEVFDEYLREYSFIHLPKRERIELRENGRVARLWDSGQPVLDYSSYHYGGPLDPLIARVDLVRVTEVGGLARPIEAVIRRHVLTSYGGFIWRASNPQEVIRSRTEAELNDR